jgi:rod shape determining protein RodA
MERISWRNFDFALLGAIVVLVIFGITMIRSAVAGNIELLEQNVVQRQAIFALLGFVVMLVTAAIDYHLWSSMSRTLYIITVVLLAVLFVVGTALFGAARWFQTGFFNVLIQPSELAKPVIIIALANFFSRSIDKVHDLRWVLRSFLLTMGIVIWILLQPNLSTSILILVIWASLLWASGLKVSYVAAAGGGVLVLMAISLPLLFNPEIVNEDSLIKPYQVQRITNFIFPDPEASFGETYNVNQMQIALGSGGLLGKGLGQGPQTQLRFLKVRHIDFIFAVIGEELGFAGTVFVIGLQFFVVLRCLRAARLARDTFGALIAYGVATTIAFQSTVNIGVNLNLLPVTGLTLPFISYGGSSLLTLLIGIGLVQSVILRYKSLQF